MVSGHQPEKKIFGKKDQYYINLICYFFLSWPFGKPLDMVFKWLTLREKGKVKEGGSFFSFCTFCELDLPN